MGKHETYAGEQNFILSLCSHQFFFPFKDFEWIRKLGIRVWYLEKPSQRIQDLFQDFSQKEAKFSADLSSGWNRASSIDEEIQRLESNISLIFNFPLYNMFTFHHSFGS